LAGYYTTGTEARRLMYAWGMPDTAEAVKSVCKALGSSDIALEPVVRGACERIARRARRLHLAAPIAARAAAYFLDGYGLEEIDELMRDPPNTAEEDNARSAMSALLAMGKDSDAARAALLTVRKRGVKGFSASALVREASKLLV